MRNTCKCARCKLTRHETVAVFLQVSSHTDDKGQLTGDKDGKPGVSILADLQFDCHLLPTSVMCGYICSLLQSTAQTLQHSQQDHTLQASANTVNHQLQQRHSQMSRLGRLLATLTAGATLIHVFCQSESSLLTQHW